ncbi:hypothetical protein HMPREF1020_02570 [Clostridium sp. 7_3_54FAA]|nr:hypothetical protein HMPREF1020_02570 [Clostridium sp. 7_3_54FAA]
MADSLKTVMRKFIKYTKAVEITAQCGLISAAFVYKKSMCGEPDACRHYLFSVRAVNAQTCLSYCVNLTYN